MCPGCAEKCQETVRCSSFEFSHSELWLAFCGVRGLLPECHTSGVSMQHLYCWLRELQVVQRSPKRLDLLRRAERCAGENSLQLEGGGLSFLRLLSSPCIFSSLFHCRVLCSLILPVRLRNRAGAREELLGSPGSDPALESTTTATTAPRLNVSDLHRMLTDAYGLRGAWRLACFLSKDPLAWKKAIGACAFADGGEVNTGGW